MWTGSNTRDGPILMEGIGMTPLERDRIGARFGPASVSGATLSSKLTKSKALPQTFQNFHSRLPCRVPAHTANHPFCMPRSKVPREAWWLDSFCLFLTPSNWKPVAFTRSYRVMKFHAPRGDRLRVSRTTPKASFSGLWCHENLLSAF